MIKDLTSEYGCALALCQDVPGTVLLGGKTYSSQIIRSTDNGESWVDALSGNNLQANDIEVDPANPAHLMECSYQSSATNTYLYESFDHGENWDISSYPTLSGKGYDILFSTSVAGRFLCATSNGIYLSDDGETFNQVLDIETRMLDENENRPGEMYAACYEYGVYRSFDSGLTWTPMEDLYIDPVNVECVEIVSDSWLYAGTLYYGTFRYPLEPLGIENNDDEVLSTIAVLATPVSSSVTVAVGSISSGNILVVFDLSGRMVYSESIPASEAVQHVIVQGLAPGVYFTGLKDQPSFCRFVILGN